MKTLIALTFVCFVTSCYCVSEEELSEKALDKLLDELKSDMEMDARQKTEKAEQAADSSKLSIKPPFLKPEINECVENKCCDKRVAVIDLNAGKFTPRFPAGIVLRRQPRPGNGKCSHRGLLKVNFEAISTTCPCNSAPFFGRRMLKLVLFFAPPPDSRSGFMFGISDSESGGGYGGDSDTQKYDTEVDGAFPHINIFTNDICKDKGLPNLFETIEDALQFGIAKVTIFIANGYMRVVYGNQEVKFCSKCLFGLNNQDDAGPNGAANTDIYISMNGVVNGNPNRIGNGLCRVEASWVCPDNY